MENITAPSALKPFALLFAETQPENNFSEKIFSDASEGLTYPTGERTYSTQSGSSETSDSAA